MVPRKRPRKTSMLLGKAAAFPATSKQPKFLQTTVKRHISS